ncbi:MAG: hypothetical protein M1838_003811, partial [Thelocarpon superellum]
MATPSDAASRSEAEPDPPTAADVACTACKRRKTKCDGRRPCSRCATRDPAACVYEVHLKTAKERMLSEIEHLRAESAAYATVIGALTAERGGDDILHRLRQGENAESVARRLIDAEPSE